MKILIVGLNYAPEKVGIAVYTTGMAEAFVGRGHKVQVIAGRPYYPAWKIMDGDNALTFRRGTEAGVDITRVPHYVPRSPSGAKRLLHHASFALSALVPTFGRAIAWRPDVVLTIAPSLIAAPMARMAAALCGARSWLHIQDFELEAAFATGLLRDGKRAGRLARWLETKVLGAFDSVSAISPQMCRKLAEKGVAAERIVEFRNWTDIAAIHPMHEPSPYRAEWNIKTAKVALYSGAIANKQGIEIVVEAARLLRDRNDLTFVICGEGPSRAELERKAAGLDNIQFHDLQPRGRFNALLGLADIHLLPQVATAADLMLPSKLTGILASGRPVVVTADKGTGLAIEVEGCGLVTPPGDAAAFAAAIAQLADGTGYREMAAQARRRAEQKWDGQIILGAQEARLVAEINRIKRARKRGNARALQYPWAR